MSIQHTVGFMIHETVLKISHYKLQINVPGSRHKCQCLSIYQDQGLKCKNTKVLQYSTHPTCFKCKECQLYLEYFKILKYHRVSWYNDCK